MNDTCFGINNEGGLSFDYYHEDTDQVDGANVYNGQLSTLWVNFRQAFPDKIKETYQDLRSNSVLNYDEIVDQFINKGSNKWSESVYNEDGDFKYISMLRNNNDATNLPQVRGTGEEHLRYFLENRFNYCDSKWYAGEYISKYDPVTGDIVNNFVTLRIYTPVDESGNPRTDLVIPASADITITPYSHMYGGVRYKANGTLIQERLEANETYTFDAPNEVFNDTETAIYGAPQLSSLGDLAPLYLGYIDVGAATKLVELKIGDGTPGYQNNNLYHLAVGTNRLLKKIDIQNCAGFNQALVLTGCPNIEEVYAKGSSITGVELPNSGYLKVLQLPATITNLTLKNQLYIDDLTIEGFENLKTITIENTPVDSLDILDKAINVERVRLTNVDWHYDDASILFELIDRDIAGIDENGVNTDTMWIDGKCHIETLTGNELLEIKTLYPYLDITYTTLTSQLIYMSEDGTTELHRETIYNGGDGTGEFDYDQNNTLRCELGSIEYNTGSLSDSNTRLRTDYIATNNVSVFNLSFNDMPYTKFLVRVYKTDGSFISFNSNAASAWTGSMSNNWYIIGSGSGTFDLNKYASTVGLSSNDIKHIRFILAIDDTTAITEIKGSITINDVVYYLAENTSSATFVKPSTAQYDFTFGGWSLTPNSEPNPNALKNVEADRTVYVAFNKTIRSYTVKFYNGTTLLYSTVVEYGDDATYVGSTPTNNSTGNTSDFEFYGWSPNPTNIQGNTNCYAQYYDKREITNDWATIAKACLDGTATDKYAIGSYKNLHIGAVDLPYEFTNGSAIVWNNEIHIFGGDNNLKKHYKWDGSEWSEVSTLPYDFRLGCSVIYNNEIHILGSSLKGYNHYKWDGVEWSAEAGLPYSFYQGSVVVYNDEIHILGSGSTDNGAKHYKWNGIEWTAVSTLPYSIRSGSAMIYKDEIHILGGSNTANHHKWNGSEWISASKLPNEYTNYVVVLFENQIHAFCPNSDKKHYKWTETEWVEVSKLYNNFSGGSGIVYNNEICVLGGSSTLLNFYHYSSETSKWTPFGTTETIPMEVIAHNHDELADGVYKWEKIGLPGAYTDSFMYNSKTFVYCNSSYRYYDGSSWVTSDIPNLTNRCLNSTYNNELHGFTKDKKHYKYDGTSWVEVGDVPQEFTGAISFEYNGVLYIMSGTYFRNHWYEYDGTTWTYHSENMPLEAVDYLIHDGFVYLFGTGGTIYSFDGASFVKTDVAAPTNSSYKFILLGDKLYAFKLAPTTTVSETPLCYVYENDTWVCLGALPYNFGGNAFVYNNEIHLVGGTNNYSQNALYGHWKWSGPSWKERIYGTVSYQGSMVVYKNELYSVTGQFANEFKKWNGDSWTKLDNAPTYATKAVVYNDEIHIFNGTSHAKWDGTAWITGVSVLPTSLVGSDGRCGIVVVYDGKIHIINGNIHRAWDGSEWTQISTLPYDPVHGRGIVYNNEIHVMSSNAWNGGYEHYKWNGVEWTKASTLPYRCYNCSTAVFNNELHIFGGTQNLRAHYKWDGIKWTKVSALPFDLSDTYREMAIVYRGKMYIKTSNRNLFCYENPRATLTFLAKNALKDDRNMTDYRTWLNETMFSSLSSELQSDIKLINKYAANNQKQIRVTEDKLWIPSANEVGFVGNTSYYVDGEGETYPIFTNDASRIKTKYNSSDASEWYTRSLYVQSSNCKISVRVGGWLGVLWYNPEAAICFGFCI